jgi:hypothetical protein
MSEEYKLLAQLPFADPEPDAISRIAANLTQPVSLGPEGAPEVNTTSFLIYGFVPDDVDRQAAADLFDLDTNLTLVITDPDEAEQLVATPIAQSMTKIALLLAAVSEARGIIVTDYTPGSIILRFENGQVTLNQDWEGWRTMPEALAVIPEPRTMKSLQGRS